MPVEYDKVATREVFGDILADMAEKNNRIMYLAGDTMSVGGKQIHSRFPERGLNVGIAEQNMALMGAGMAACGAKVFVASYAPFASMRICEQIRTFIAYPMLNVKIVSGMGGFGGATEGVTHQGTEDISIIRSIPNMVVVVPADASSTAVIAKAMVEYDGPAYIRFGNSNLLPKVFDKGYKFEIGKANIMKSEGTDAAIIACGVTVSRCKEAEKILRQRGYSVKLIEMACIKPIDKEAILWVAKECRAIVTAEDNNIVGGLGSAVSEVLSEAGSCVKLKRIGLEDVFAQSGEYGELLDFYGMSAKTIADESEILIKRNEK